MALDPSDRRAGPVAKVERAKSHLDELMTAVTDFLKVHKRTTEEDHETGEVVYRITPFPSVPPLSISLIIGDVAHNLRAALDLLAWQLVEANGGEPGVNTSFPIDSRAITPTVERVRSLVNRRLKGAHPDAIALASAKELYFGGKGHALWMVNELDRIDKHRLLVVAVTTREGVDILFEQFAREALRKMLVAEGKDPAEADAVIYDRTAFTLSLAPKDRKLDAGGELFRMTTAGPVTNFGDFVGAPPQIEPQLAVGIGIDDFPAAPTIGLPETPNVAVLMNLADDVSATITEFSEFL